MLPILSPLASAPGPTWLLGSQVCRVSRVHFQQQKTDGGSPGLSIGACVLTANGVTCAEVLMVSCRPGGADAPVRGPRQVPEKTRLGRGQCRGSELLGNSTVGVSGLLLSQDRDPIIPSTRKVCFSSRERTRLPAGSRCQQVIFPSFILSHLHAGVPRKARFSHCTRRPLQERVTGFSWSKSWPLASGKQRPRKSKGCAQVTSGSCRSRVRLQLPSLGNTIGLVASWQSLTLPCSWTLCLPTSAVYHTGAFGRLTRKIHDLHEVVGRERPMVGQA